MNKDQSQVPGIHSHEETDSVGTWHSWEPGNLVCQLQGKPASESIPFIIHFLLGSCFSPVFLLLSRFNFMYLFFISFLLCPVSLLFPSYFFLSHLCLFSFVFLLISYLSLWLFFLVSAFFCFSLSLSLLTPDTHRYTWTPNTEKEAESNCMRCRRSFSSQDSTPSLPSSENWHMENFNSICAGRIMPVLIQVAWKVV